MADSSIQLINSSAAVSADAFNRIDRAMFQSIEATRRSGEFAVGMTAKTADAIETARMHDATIMNMQANTYLQGEKLAMEKSLMPLRVATETLRFQAEQARFLKEKKNADLKYMSDIFATYDDMMGRNILSSGNKNLAKDYLGYKAKWQSHLINGGKFDAGQFQGDLNKMVEHHKDGDGNPTEEWNPETQYLYESISPSLGKAYQLKNPVIQKNRNGMAVSTLTATDAGFSEFWKGFGNLYSAEESGLIGMGRSVYQSNEFIMDSLEKSNSRLQSNLSLMSDADPRKESTTREIAENQAKIDRARRQNNLIMDNYSQGKYGVPTEEAPSNTTKEDSEAKAKLEAAAKQETKAVYGVRPVGGFDVQGQQMSDRLSSIKSAIAYKVDGKEFTYADDVGLAWFGENRQDKEPNDTTKTNILNSVEQRIEASKNLSDNFTPEKTNKLFSLLKGTDVKVPIDDYTHGLINYGKSAIKEGEKYPINSGPYFGYGAPTKDQSYLSFGKSGQFTSFEDMMKSLNKISNIHERQVATQSVYAALVTAVLSDSVTNR